MEKRYKIFVSSTFLDLQEERQQVMQALLELDCMPAGMELFPASDEEKWNLITRVIDDCDYYIVIIGGRYGSVDSEGISYTEREYVYATELGIPVLAFVHAQPDAIVNGKSEISPEGRERLARFREKVEKRMCKMWKTPDELGGVVSRSLVQIIRLKPGEGWVRARYASDPEELQRLQSRITELTDSLQLARTQEPSEAAALAKGEENFVLNYSIDDKRYGETMTWDDIFSVLGPLMFDEASESDLTKKLRDTIANKRNITTYTWKIDVHPDDFQTIKIQLMALGLIQKSIKKHPLRDSGTYWSLTLYGEHSAILLKAIPTAIAGD